MAPRFYRCENGHECESRTQPCPVCRTEVVYFVKAEGPTEAEEDGVLRVITLRDKVAPPPPRYATGIAGFDRILGGGLTKGAVVLVGGPPGSGKTTLVIKALANIAANDVRCLFLSGEQNEAEVQVQAKRLGARDERLYLAVTKSVEEILEAVRLTRPRVVAVDSINVVYTTDATAGEMAQIKVAAQKLVDAAKHRTRGFTLIFIGHITKDDTVAGPKQLEHLVDVIVTYTETPNGRRLLKSGKNRHGPAGEIAVFEMTNKGLVEISAAAALIVAPKDVPEKGYVVFPMIESAKPVLLEVESRVAAALAEGAVPISAERRYAGMDASRMPAVLAVLREDSGLDLRGRDLFLEVSSAWGETVVDPGIDLAAATSIVSSADGRTLPAGLVAVGSVGITGKIRPVQRIEDRLAAAKAAGFQTVILSKQQLDKVPSGMRAIGLTHVKELREEVKTLAQGCLPPVKQRKPKARAHRAKS